MLIGFDGYFRYFLVLEFMVGLIGLLAVLLGRLNAGSALFVATGKSRDKRLGIVETLAIIAQRLLVLLRRDDNFPWIPVMSTRIS